MHNYAELRRNSAKQCSISLIYARTAKKEPGCGTGRIIWSDVYPVFLGSCNDVKCVSFVFCRIKEICKFVLVGLKKSGNFP